MATGAKKKETRQQMATFYIFEGPDGAGKSTLLQRIAASHQNVKIVRFSYPKCDAERTLDFQFNQYAAPILQEAKSDSVVLLDRSWYSNRVYGNVMHNQEILSYEQSKALELMVIGAGGGTIVYCTAPINTLWKRCQTRGEDHVKKQAQLLAIREGYEELMKLPKCLPVLRIDTGVQW